MKKITVLTGAGISAESGISTFRDSGGLWENYDIMEVASYGGWLKNPSLVIDFYNARRAQLATVEPNAGHKVLAELQELFDMHIITQNVDNLHERAGSRKVLHLHGELTKVRSSANLSHIEDIGTGTIELGQLAPDGSQVRPHIVWFGEAVPEIENAINIARSSDIFIVVGTSLNVYPAAGVLNYVPRGCPVFLVDPSPADVAKTVTLIAEPATTGLAKLKTLLLEKYI
jgi:NAD-dependent deacetylase